MRRGDSAAGTNGLLSTATLRRWPERGGGGVASPICYGDDVF